MTARTYQKRSLHSLLAILIALALAHALWQPFPLVAEAAQGTDDRPAGGDAHVPLMQHLGLRDGHFFDSLDVLNEPITHTLDPPSRLQRILSETAEERRRREAAAREAHVAYTAHNDTLSSITTLSMSSVATMDGASSCSASLGCPRSSVAWASGTFTFTELLTPASLSTETNLSLKISLCCDYKFHGALLRDPARYDQFLSFLLQASPFQVLSAHAKTQLLPRHKAFIVNSKTGQAYDHTYELSEADRQSGNDGDGDVIVLFTGRVDPAALAKVSFSSLRSPTTSATSGLSSVGRGQREAVEATLEDSSADMQLKIVNTVLKCKCPHTLLVMPLLHMQRDTLPPISILGLGPHCGVTPTQTPVKPHRYVTRVLREGVAREQVEAVLHNSSSSSSSSSSTTTLRGVEDLVGYATSFIVSPPVLPASAVQWVVREDGPAGRVVLNHSRVLVPEVDTTGALLLDHAPSPYWMVEPDVRYRVHVTVSRQGVQRSSEGTFTMRLPFHRPWALPPVRPAPHFGFDRMLHLSAQETLSHAEVPNALDARKPSPSPSSSSPSGGRRALFYYGYWENTPLQDQLLPQRPVHVRHNPYDSPDARFPLFIGKNILAYFVRDVDDVCDPVPLEGRELWAVQGIITTPTPLTACAEEQDIAALLLRQLLWRMRHERRFLVNLPATSWTSTEAEEGLEGAFACRLWDHPTRGPRGEDTTTSEAQRRFCRATRTIDGGVSGTTARLRLPYRDVYRVVWEADLVVDNISSATAMLIPENIDSDYVTVHYEAATGPANKTNDSKQSTTTEGETSASATESGRGTRIRIEVRSRPHVVVRRIATYPAAITVELPMHERSWRVSPPRPLVSSFAATSASTDNSAARDTRHQPYLPRETFGAEDEAPTGYWRARNPLALYSVNERLEAHLDARDVPNVQRTLPNGTLVFVAQDAGEDLTNSYGISYLARCPDVPVEVLVSVVAIKAPPITPAYVPVYTEDSCVEVRPPRALRKDETLEWRVPSCAHASHPPFLVQREISYDDAALEAAAARSRARRALRDESARNEQQRRRRRRQRGSAGQQEWEDDETDKDASWADAEPESSYEDEDLPGVPIPGTGGHRRAVMLACGVEVYAHCDVVWTATNLVGLVSKTYSLRRCQRPPDVVFHVDGLQQDRSVPSRYFALPSIVERVLGAVPTQRNASRDGTWQPYNNGGSAATTRTIGMVPEEQYVPYAVTEYDTDGLRAVVLHESPHALTRTVIPIAGYDADIGYSFNFTGPQAFFEAEMTPLVGHAANQLLRTRAHFAYSLVDPDSGGEDASQTEAEARGHGPVPPLIWRRLTRLDLVLAAEHPMPSSYDDDDAYGGDLSRDDHYWRSRSRGEHHDDADSDEPDDWEYLVSGNQRADDDEAFWADLYSGRRGHDGADGHDENGVHPVRSPAEIYFRRLQREAQRRTRAEDERLNRELLLRHHVDRRRLEFHRLHNASLYPMDYVVRASRIAPNAAADADRPEFAKRGMCVEHAGHTSVLVVNPRGAVMEDERYGTILPPPPLPAVAVLPFCQPQFVFSRHPDLDRVYHYDFTWECEDTAVLQAAKHNPVYSTITHVEEPARNGNRTHHHNATNCRLVVQNHLTETIQSDWFLLQRVFPTVLTPTHFVLLGDGAARTVLVRAPSKSTTASRRGYGHGPARVDSQEVPYERRPNGFDGRPRRVVGPSAVVHVDAPSNPHTARWSLRSFIPQLGDPAGTEAIMAHVHFTSLFQHPAAIARGRGGSTALVKNLNEPGLYTIGHHLPDPAYPHVCPNVSLVETLDVFRARVVEKELFICGGTATLRAVPIPQDISHEFIGQWEVVALQTAPEEVWTRGLNFTGIRFDHGSRDTTLVHGLPFGILTIRWAVYRVYTEGDDDYQDDATMTGLHGGGGDNDDAYTFQDDGDTAKLFSREAKHGYAHDSARTHRHGGRTRRVLVDYDSVRVVVLTENLFSHRLVTLSSAADVLTTSSTVDWHIRDSSEDASNSNSNNNNVKRRKGGAWGKSNAGWQDHLDARLGWQPLMNFTDYYPVDDPVLFPYVGAHPPRPGTGLLSMDQVPVGTTELMYTLRPSENVFGPMIGQTCELRGAFLIERVSAYFTVNTTLDHECDGYTGKAKVSMCLHAEVPPGLASKARQQPQRRGVGGTASHMRRSSSASQDAWAANVQLVPLDALERVIKSGAQQVEASGCATPWWVWPETRWSDLTTTRREGLPAGRCVRFTVQAGRHLSPREVSLPLFLATPGSAGAVEEAGRSARRTHGRSVALVDGNGAVIAGSGDGTSGVVGGAGRAHNSSTSRGHRVCAATPDFITSRVIEGAGHISLEDTTTTTTSAASGASKRSDRGVAGSFIFSHQQKHHRGMLAYLPILDPHTLYRRDVAMRPLVGLQGLPDDVTTELNVTHGNESVVTLRLDLSEPRLLGGYVPFHDPKAAPVLDTEVGDIDNNNNNNNGGDDAPRRMNETPLNGDHTNTTDTSASSSSSSSSSSPHPQRTRRQSLLLQCVHGQVRASDVLQFWSETNRPDGAAGRTADEWLEYVYAVQDMAVPCEILFPSLDYILSTTEVIGRNGKARVVATSTTSDAVARRQGGGAAIDDGKTARHPLSLPSHATERPPHDAQLVSLEIVEMQLERIQRAFRVTQDGIDVTGLRPELQLALARRRLTPQQLRELEQTRQTLQKEERARTAKERLELMNAPGLMKRADRVLRMMEAYRGATGMEPSAIRLRLPRYDAFSVPYDLLLRTALHKDVVCGTDIAYPPAVPSHHLLTPVPNRHSLVTLGRVEIVDMPPQLTPPGPLKQCEVEGDVPVLLVNISGAVFSEPYFTGDRVELQELPNPNLPPNRSPLVGLTPCLGTLRNSMHAVVDRGSHKLLYLQLSACPAFQMLSSEEYNEYQDSDELLRRLQHPRFLEVRIRDALRPDSFTARSRSGARDVTFVVEVRPTLARLHLHAAELADTQAPPPPHSSNRRAASATVRSVLPWGGGGGAGAQGKTYEQRRSGSTFEATAQRPLLMCESDLRRNGFELGIELIGDTWTRPVGLDGEYDAAAAAEAEAASRRESAGQPWRPTITARGTLNEPTRRRAPQNTALINSFSIVEHYSLDSTHHLYLKGGGVYRSHFVNYLFSTILADRDILSYHEFIRRYNDTFVSVEVPPQPGSAMGGLDRLEVWGEGGVLHDTDDDDYGDAASRAAYSRGRGRYDGTGDDLRAQRAWRALPTVRRFSKVEEILFAVPGIATNCHGCLLADTTFFVAGDLTGLWAFLDTSSSSSSSAAGSRASAPLSPHHLTSKQLPAFGTPTLETAFLSRPLIIPWHAAEYIPQQWHLMWLCPPSAYRALEQFQQYWRAPVVNTAGEGGAYVEASVVVYALRDAMGVELSPEQRPTTLLTSEPVPLARVLKQSQQQQQPQPSGTAVLASNVRFQMNASSISAAYTAVAADLLRYHRPQVLASHAFDFHRDGLYTEGLLSVNASVFVKLCVPLPSGFKSEREATTDAEARRAAEGTGEVRARRSEEASAGPSASSPSGPHRQCMIVSITDTLLTVEAPPTSRPRPRSWLRRLVGLRSGGGGRASGKEEPSPRYAAPLASSRSRAGAVDEGPLWTWPTLLHNALLALLVYVLIPNLGLVDSHSEAHHHRNHHQNRRTAHDDLESHASFTSSLQDHGASPARVGLSAMAFVALMFASAQSPTRVWVACWLAIWSAALYIFKAAETVVCFVISAVYWRLTVDMV